MTTTPTETDPSAGPVQVALDDLPSLVGSTLGTSPSLSIEQGRIDEFAEATEDRQWIHVDTDRSAEGPFGTTIAHGFLTLSVTTKLLWQIIDVPDAARIVNYGVNKVRFPAPVPSGSQVSMTAEVTEVKPIDDGYQVTFATAAVVAGGTKPSCVAELVFRYLREG